MPWLKMKRPHLDYISGDMTVLCSGRVKKIKSVTSAVKEKTPVRPDWLMSKKSFKKLLKQKKELQHANSHVYMIAPQQVEELLLAEDDDETPAACCCCCY